MSLILRTQMDRKMTAIELDSNFTYLNSKSRTLLLSNCLIKTDFIVVDEPDTELYSVSFIGYPSRLSEINLSQLATTQTVVVRGNPYLTSIDMSKLETSQESIYIRENDSLSSVDISSLINCNLLRISENHLLTTININIGASFSVTNISFRDNALTQESIDNILFLLDNSGLDGTGVSPSYTIDLSNQDIGNNATPSSTASTYISNLESKGWTVTTN